MGQKFEGTILKSTIYFQIVQKKKQPVYVCVYVYVQRERET